MQYSTKSNYKCTAQIADRTTVYLRFGTGIYAAVYYVVLRGIYLWFMQYGSFLKYNYKYKA